jgi:hypothetical protein
MSTNDDHYETELLINFLLDPSWPLTATIEKIKRDFVGSSQFLRNVIPQLRLLRNKYAECSTQCDSALNWALDHVVIAEDHEAQIAEAKAAAPARLHEAFLAVHDKGGIL